MKSAFDFAEKFLESADMLTADSVGAASVENGRGEKSGAVVGTIPEMIDDPPRAWIAKDIRDDAGKLIAVKISSALLDDHIYIVLDPDFIPPEPLVVYWEEQIEAMKDKSPEQVLEIHKVKMVFRGARVIQ